MFVSTGGASVLSGNNERVPDGITATTVSNFFSTIMQSINAATLEGYGASSTLYYGQQVGNECEAVGGGPWAKAHAPAGTSQ